MKASDVGGVQGAAFAAAAAAMLTRADKGAATCSDKEGGRERREEESRESEREREGCRERAKEQRGAAASRAASSWDNRRTTPRRLQDEPAPLKP